jgi:glyoxylase-like metal-dependent hydrolase (beta-lactamase superfamily II)
MSPFARILRLLLIPWVACAALSAGCAAPEAIGSVTEPVAQKVADGVYLLRGVPGEADTETLGRVGNAGFIVGDSGVIAIDTGVSYRHGVALLKAIRQVTGLPIRLALVTQTHQEFLFGAAAYREQGIPIHMQRQAAGLMASRCDNCLKTLKRVLGEDQMRGTVMFKPDQVFDDAPLLTQIGRPVQVLYFGHSSGPGDIAVLDTRSGVLFAGGLVDHLRIPDVQDGELPAWHAALNTLRALPLRRIVPGHGPVAGVDSIESVQRYLTRLEARVLELIRSGAALSDVPDAAGLPEFKDWDQYDIIHRRNASVLFVRMEREQMFK